MDDTINILPACEEQLLHLKNILQDFALSSGLKINFQKSILVPINVNPSVAADLAAEFGCKIGKMPFTYLGLPLGTTKPTMTDLLPLVDRVEIRLSSTCSLLCHASRITLVNSVATSMINFAMCTLQLNAGFMQYFDKVTRRFVWTKKNEQGESSNSLVAWQRVYCPKAHGGLGVVNIKVQNQVLLLKFLDKFYNRAEMPWVRLFWDSYYLNSVPHVSPICGSFWWKQIYKVMPIFRGISS